MFMFTSLLEDIRVALRLLRKTPGITAVAAFSIAISVGAAAVVFTAIETVLIRPLPYSRAGELVQFRTNFRNATPSVADWVSWNDMQDVARASRTLASVGTYRYAIFNRRRSECASRSALRAGGIRESVSHTRGDSAGRAEHCAGRGPAGPRAGNDPQLWTVGAPVSLRPERGGPHGGSERTRLHHRWSDAGGLRFPDAPGYFGAYAVATHGFLDAAGGGPRQDSSRPGGIRSGGATGQGRFARAGTSGPVDGRQAAGRGLSGHQRNSHARHGAARRTHAGIRANRADPADGIGSVVRPDRLRERGQSATGARPGAAPRDRGPVGAGSGPRQNRPSTGNRELRAGQLSAGWAASA